MTKAKLEYLKNYCSEPLELIENYQQAEADGFEGWCIHHRLEIQPDGTRVSAQELNDKNLYFHRPANELVFMRCGEHMTLHNKGENHPLFGKHHSAETRLKMSEANKGKHLSEEHRQKLSESRRGENHPFFGKHLSEEHRRKLSMSFKGLYKGTRWWNNGISSKLSRECPGPEWKRGRI